MLEKIKEYSRNALIPGLAVGHPWAIHSSPRDKSRKSLIQEDYSSIFKRTLGENRLPNKSYKYSYRAKGVREKSTVRFFSVRGQKNDISGLNCPQKGSLTN